MNGVTEATKVHCGKGWMHRALLMSGIVVLPLALTFCGGGDDGGGGGGGGGNNNTPPPATGGDNQFAYVIGAAASEVSSYKVDGDGNLTQVGGNLATGVDPHHVNVDPQGRWVYVSNHNSPFISGYRITQPDGILTPMSPDPGSPVTGSDPTENQPHSSVLDQTQQFLYAIAGPETGAPSFLRAYRVDQNTGALTFIPGQTFQVGIHAHNIAISPNNQFIYVASEASNDVHAFSRNTSTGELTVLPTVTGLNNPEAVVVDPQSKFAYVTHRNEVLVYQIGSDGSLTPIPGTNAFPTGNEPHSLAMHPNGQTLYVANLNSATITVFRVDPNTGALTNIQSPAPPTGVDPNFIIVHPNGQSVFTADNVSDQISRFAVNADGTLVTPLTATPSLNGANGIGTTKFP